jgi:hypothetical protein
MLDRAPVRCNPPVEADGMQPNTLTMLTALVGVVIGTAGFVISLLNYFRDRPKVIVRLGWDYISTDEDDSEKTRSGVTVTNVGRRPIFVSHAHLTYPNTTVITVMTKSLHGAKLLEGDPPTIYSIDDTAGLPRLGTYAAEWWKVRVRVVDHTGKNWWSARAIQKPNWGTGPSPTSWQWLRYRLITEAPVIRSIHLRLIIRKRKQQAS